MGIDSCCDALAVGRMKGAMTSLSPGFLALEFGSGRVCGGRFFSRLLSKSQSKTKNKTRTAKPPTAPPMMVPRGSFDSDGGSSSGGSLVEEAGGEDDRL
jgi:hypothetical protein